MNVLGQKWNHGGLGHQREAVGGNGCEKGRLVGEGEEYGFSSAASLQDCGQHDTRRLRKLAFGRHGWAKVRKRFHRTQDSPKIVVLHCHSSW